jgi:phosphatidylglycerol:prolipoprotein diacylglycerol transferase
VRLRIIDHLHQLGYDIYIPGYKDIYIFMIVIAIVLSCILAKKRGLPVLRFYFITVLICTISLVGARIYHVLTHLQSEPDFSFASILSSSDTASFGAFIFGIAGGILLLKFMKIDILTALDVYTPALAVSHFIGRLGCFMAGCCFGIPSNLPWAVRFPPHSPAHSAHLAQGFISGNHELSLPVHPLQLYESLFGLVLFVIVIYLFNKPLRKGALFFAYIICYALFRFFMEFLRGDDRPVVSSFSLPQVLSVIFIISSISFLSISFIKHKKLSI